jgi:hypothetical protein
MNDAADDAPVIDTRLAARIGRQMRQNPRKLRLAQPEPIPNHHDFLPETVNHNTAVTPSLLWVRTLGRRLSQKASSFFRAML